MSDSAFHWTSEEIIVYVKSLIDEVRNIPKELRQSAKFEVNIIKKHKTFYDSFKMLVKKILYDGGNFNLNELEKLMKLRDKMKSGHISKEDANKKIGQEYYDKYAAPVVENLSATSLQKNNMTEKKK